MQIVRHETPVVVMIPEQDREFLKLLATVFVQSVFSLSNHKQNNRDVSTSRGNLDVAKLVDAIS